MVARTLNAARVYLGTMNFGWAQASSVCDAPVAAEMLKRFAAYGGNRLDTARIYASGEGEANVREAIERSGISDWRLGSKAAPSADKGLSSEGIHGQFDASRNALEMDGALDEYFLHQPDPHHSLEETLQTMDVLVGMDVVREVGLSNFHVDEVRRAFDICDEYGLAYPSVYQGLYNPLNRLVEDELLPFLRERNCRFVAYNGLAAGLLTGKHRQGEAVLAGRFKNNDNYLPRFYTSDNFEAVERIRKACDDAGVGMVAATYAWLLNHSALREDDGVLLGASSLEQLDVCLEACANIVDLPDKVRDAFDGAWDLTRPGAFKYWRSYSADMPDRETRDPGAAYDAAAAKKK